ncbi:MAG: magnesium chelatase domain-containing protein [Anaerolineae bacterium]
MLSVVRACALFGLEGRIVEVETDFNPRAGFPSFSIVGLPDNAVRECRERVRAVIKIAGWDFLPRRTWSIFRQQIYPNTVSLAALEKVIFI